MKPFLWILLLAVVAATPSSGGTVWGQRPDDDLEEPEPPNPALESLLESNPQTPRELLEMVLALVDFDRAALAAPYLKRLRTLGLKSDALADLVAEVGSDRLIRLSRITELAPGGSRFAQSALKAADQRARDPARLAALFEQLRDPAPEVRHAALVDMKAGQQDAVIFLLRVLADPKRRADHSIAGNAIVSMGPLAEGPLMGALDAHDPALLAQVIPLVPRLGLQRARYLLLRPASVADDPLLRQRATSALTALVGAAPSRQAAAIAARRQIKRYLSGVRPEPPDHEGMVVHWGWNPTTKQPLGRPYPVDDYGMLLARQLAADLVVIEPDSPDTRRLYLMTQAEAAAIEAGGQPPADGPISEILAEQDVDTLEDLLSYAMAEDRLATATAVAEALGKTGQTARLTQGMAHPRPLVQAAHHPDPQLRFAAAQAILALAPQEPYAGSSYVMETLGQAARGGTRPRAVVGDPHTTDGRNLAALLDQAGYDVELAYSGRQLFRAARQTGVDLVWIHSKIDDPPLREVIYRLRRHPDTGRVAIGVIAPLDDLARAQRLAADDPLAIALPRPHTLAAMQQDIAALVKSLGRRAVSPAERQRQAKAALRSIGQIAADGPDFYQVRNLVAAAESALQIAGSRPAAAATLAHLGTPGAQQALIELASGRLASLADRQLAAESFASSVNRHGLLLTTDQIVRQYERYNASASGSPQAQAILGTLLDVIERHTKTENDPTAQASP